MFTVTIYDASSDYGNYTLTAKTLRGAKSQATELVNSIVPRWEYTGYGPTIIILQAGSEIFRKKF